MRRLPGICRVASVRRGAEHERRIREDAADCRRGGNLPHLQHTRNHRGRNHAAGPRGGGIPFLLCLAMSLSGAVPLLHGKA